ncbi:MAG: hypothetical protein DRR19_10400 [Candidatus Parabeggiatoa sp. nov. 1]|nr:MAG: hypothetical protein DRR19_10400 [Gammaproteobacteria bacterium]
MTFLWSSLAVAQTPAQCDTVYAIHDQGTNNSQFFTYHLTQDSLELLGELLKAADIEGLSVHPNTRQLYASSGKANAQLYNVDGQTGELSLIGEIGYDDVVGLAFHPDGTLWGWSKQGLLQIDIDTGAGALILSETHPIHALTWNQDGTLLYGTADDAKSHSTLWQWVPGTDVWTIACHELPKKVESLETLPGGLFVYGFHDDVELGIHIYDAIACQTSSEGRIDTLYNDIEGIAWPVQNCHSANKDALRAYMESLDGVQAVEITDEGAIAVTIQHKIHHSQLAKQVTPGTMPPADGELIMAPINDANGDDIADFLITYPSGNQQVLYYYGIIDESPTDCQTLEVPPIDPTVISIPALVTQFLYSGENPIQTGVATDTIDLERAATLRGQVTTSDGEPLPNVIITVKDHPEYGQTKTTCDGFFNMAVNGGATLTVNYQLDGYLPVQRQVKPSWQEYAVIDEVAMTALDPQVSVIDLTANQPIQVAQGRSVTDEDGTRQAVVLFPQGVTAVMTLPDGSTQPLTQLDVRATEYTVGDNGPEAMPAPLPPQSGYTYAVELSVDQAIAVGATRVDFSQPVPLYVDNFLNFPVGGIVPVGWYDRSRSAWVPSDNGRVIKIISIDNGLALLDVDGSGQAASTEALAELGITEAERQQLASLYAPGKSLWRSPIPHFTPWDCNWPYSVPSNAVRSSGTAPQTKDDNKPDKPSCKTGCIIEAESQVLGETIPVAGTPFSLNYRSNRVPGRKTAYTLEIPLRGDSVPDSLKRIVLEINIAGQQVNKAFSVDRQSTTFVWDGKDAFGRKVQGRQEAKVRIGYVYGVVYTNPSEFQQSFARLGEGPISAGRGQADITLWKEYTKSLGAGYPLSAGMGSFSLNVHHTYDPIAKILYSGNGKQRRVTNINAAVINTVAGNGGYRFSGDGGLATKAGLSPMGIAFGPDGSLYITDFRNSRIHRVDVDGIINTVAGNGSHGFSGDGGLATEASLRNPIDIAFGPDGSLYIADSGNHRIRRVDVDGIIHTVAGDGSRVFSGDGGLATEAGLHYPTGITFGPDGSLYITDSGNHRIRRVGVDGIINTVAGLNLNNPRGIAFGPDGGLYIADTRNHRIRRVGVNGIFNTVVGRGHYAFSGDGGLATEAGINPVDIAFGPDGSLYIVDVWNYRIRRVGVDGIINTVAGKNREKKFSGDGGLATEANLYSPQSIAFGPDGSFYIADSGNSRIRRVSSMLPGFSLENIILASEVGGLLYEFTPEGRHLRTLDSITGKAVYTFAYTENGYLQEIQDLDGDITRIERSGDTPVAIIAPKGQRTALTLDDNGYLNSMTNPAGEAYQLHYTDDGLLKEFIDPRSHKSVYRYDELGLLVEDTDAAGGGWTLARTDHSDDSYTTTMTSKKGRVTRYQVEPQTNGDMLRVNTSPDGTATQTLIKTNGETVTISADGTQIVSKQGPDPRFGMQAPITAKMTLTTPNGLSALVTTEKTAELTDASNPLSVAKLTTKVTNNGRTSQSVYEAASKTVTATSAAGRQSVSYMDDNGRVIKKQVPGLVDVHYSYDSRGRVIEVRQGEGELARTTTLSYDDNSGYLKSVVDALGRTETYNHDAIGRITTQKLIDGREIHYSYDANGNVASITPPGREAHRFAYNQFDLQAQYTPPALAEVTKPETRYEYNRDKQLTQIVRPDGQTVVFNYHATTGRLENVVLPHGQQSYTYDNNSEVKTGNLSTITAPDNSTLSYSYDGSLPLSETWDDGFIKGTLALTYDNYFRVTAARINDANTINYQYDTDSLLAQAGDLTLTHDAQHGLLTATELGNLKTERTYNRFGEIETETATYNGNTGYSVQYVHDKLGRITQKTETVGNTTSVWVYGYDDAGRLSTVSQDGVITEQYSYDSNGNRLSATTQIYGTANGTYDAQDRLTQYGENTYAYTANGELQTKTRDDVNSQYGYDVLGNLRSVQLDGKQIEYVIDGRNRRVGKKVNGALTQGFLYQGSLNPIAELDGDGNVVSVFVYGSKANVPDYMLKGGKTYRILSDHLGSPRLVIDITDGSVVQRMDYDAFGNVLSDSNIGFQPFGFAGGIYDADTGLTRFGARDYDPETGRWTAKDPIGFDGGDSNLYGYVLSDPVNLVDPFGLLSNKSKIAICALVVAGKAINKGERCKEIVRDAMYNFNLHQICKSGSVSACQIACVANEFWKELDKCKKFLSPPRPSPSCR